MIRKQEMPILTRWKIPLHSYLNTDPEVKIISEQRREANNEPIPKKIKLSSDESTDTDNNENCTTSGK